jgi:Carboxypeptidase regulatory-like domain
MDGQPVEALRLIARCLFAALAVISVQKAIGCECAASNICEKVLEVPVIFLGEVIEGGLEPGRDAWDAATSSARLRVVERFKGLPKDAKEVVVQLNFMPGMCSSVPYRKGEQTLVFAARDDEEGLLGDGPCTDSQFAKDVPDELAYVRRYFKGQTSPTIWGRIAANETASLVDFVLDVDKAQPMEGARVTVEGRGKLRSATTDRHGRYEISGLEPGDYVVRGSKDGYAGEGEFKVQVKGRGCAIQNLGLFARNSVEGRVIDPDGKPVVGVSVYLRKVGEEDTREKLAGTDTQGGFRFEKLNPGSYYLVLSPHGPTPDSPFGARFYGGAESRELAKPIEIAATSVFRGYDINSSKALTTRNIRVALTWPDGKPVKWAYVVCAEDSEWYRNVGVSSSDDGVAICRVLAGREYRVRVQRVGLRVVAPSEAREVVAAAGFEDVEVSIQVGQMR